MSSYYRLTTDIRTANAYKSTLALPLHKDERFLFAYFDISTKHAFYPLYFKRFSIFLAFFRIVIFTRKK